ncbi:MAG: hypothetical protein R2753_10325 [Chitinophagales bacterium]
MKNLKNLTLTIITGLTLLASSCTTNEVNPIINDASKVMERLDLKIVSHRTEHIYKESMQNDGWIDLVDYSFYNDEEGKIDFVINIDDSKTITVRVTNRLNPNPYEVLDTYGTFAPQDQDDKYKYVTVEFMDNTNAENTVYISNLSENLPQGGFLDVFRIEKYSVRDMQILCRLNNIVLYQLNNPEKTITIDGTFRGALTFL